MQEQDRQDEPLLQPAQRDRLALVDHLERPEDPVLHNQVLPLPKPERKQPAPRVLYPPGAAVLPLVGDSRGMARSLNPSVAMTFAYRGRDLDRRPRLRNRQVAGGGAWRIGGPRPAIHQHRPQHEERM